MLDAQRHLMGARVELKAVPQLPLVLDLDGTLLKTDLLWECFIVAVRQNPVVILFAVAWLFQGRATLEATPGTLRPARRRQPAARPGSSRLCVARGGAGPRDRPGNGRRRTPGVPDRGASRLRPESCRLRWLDQPQGPCQGCDARQAFSSRLHLMPGIRPPTFLSGAQHATSSWCERVRTPWPPRRRFARR